MKSISNYCFPWWTHITSHNCNLAFISGLQDGKTPIRIILVEKLSQRELLIPCPFMGPNKVWTIENNTNSFYFFSCILPDYVAHDIIKEFWKNSHFEKMTAGFVLRCQNLLRWNTPEIMHFQEWNFLFSPILPL